MRRAVVRGVVLALTTLVPSVAGAAPGTAIVDEIVSAMPAGHGRAIAYDRARQQLVVFGGTWGRGPTLPSTSDTWVTVDGSFTLRATTGPSPRSDAAMTFDERRGVVVLFGGAGDGLLGEEWHWDGSAWLRSEAPREPSGMQRPQLVSDASRGRLVLVDGERGETWERDDSGWTFRGTSLGSRFGVALVYDAARGQVLAFGGQQGAAFSRDLLAYDDGLWRVLEPEGKRPIGRHLAAFVFDEKRGRCVLGGGVGASGELDDTWAFDGSRWQRLDDSGSGFVGPAAWDAARDRVVVAASDIDHRHDSHLTFDGEVWQHELASSLIPEGRQGALFALDDTSSRLLLFGGGGEYAGGNIQQPWWFDGERWQEAASAPLELRVEMGFASVPGLGVLMHGGHVRGQLPDGATYLWTSQGVAAVATAGPGPRDRPALSAWGADGRAVLFGGIVGERALADTWLFERGAWRELPVGAAPPARFGASMAQDPATGDLLLFGGQTVGELLDDSWRFDGERWHDVQSDTHPPPSTRPSLVTDARQGRVVALSGDQLWAHEQGRWWRLPARGARGFGQETTLAAGPSGRLLAYGGYAPGEYHGSLFEIRALGTPCAEGCGDLGCVDGVCCEAQSCAPCRSCAVAGSEGTCAPVTPFSTDDGCDEGQVCDAAGRCASAPGAPCDEGATCSTGSCVDEVCCLDEACEGPCSSCAAGATPGRCGTVYDAPARGRCDGPSRCDARGACRLAGGAPCAAPTDCASDRCVLGACVDGDAPVCIDRHTSARADGTLDACGLARCAEGRCITACSTSADCAEGARCDQRGSCVVDGPQRGTSCATGRGVHGALVPFALLGALLLTRRRRALAVAAVALVPAASDAAGRARVSATPTSAPRAGMAVGLDPSATLLFGGRAWDNNPFASSLLRLRDGHVTHLSGEGGPPPLLGAAVGLDPATGRIVVMGGLRSDAAPNLDTFTWADDAWQHEPQAGAVSEAANARLFVDPSRARLLCVASGQRVVVLERVAGRFRELAAPEGRRITARVLTGAALDTLRGRLVVHGGYANEAFLDDTWEWDGEGWSQVAAPGDPLAPPASRGLTGAHDARTGLTVMCAPQGSVNRCSGWDGSTWRAMPGLPGGHDYTLAPTPDGRVLALSSMPLDLDDSSVMTLDDDGWHLSPQGDQPPAAFGVSAAFDPSSATGHAFGGYVATPTKGALLATAWRWRSGRWERLAHEGPSARYFASMAAMPGGGSILFGGQVSLSPTEVTNDTWRLDESGFELLDAAVAPPPRVAAAIATDTTRGRVIVTGGSDAVTLLDDTWAFEGGWTRLDGALSPTPRRLGAAMTFDERRGVFVLFGGQTFGSERLADTWELRDGRWSVVTTTHAPPPMQFPVAYYDDRAKLVVVAGSDPTSGGGIGLWAFDGDDWSKLGGATAATERTGAGAFFDRTSGVGVLVGGEPLPTTSPDERGWLAIALSGQLCAGHDTCATGHCVDGVCCEQAACGPCAACDLQGTEGTCAPLDPGTPAPSGCAEGQLCDGHGRCVNGPAVPCDDVASCLSGHCVDGVCCQQPACPGTCQSCAAPGHEGTCSRVINATDDTCNGVHTCNDQGDCLLAEGQRCEAPTECASSICGDGACQPGGAPYCEGRRLLHAPDGSTRDCAPYACGARGCLRACEATDECAPGFRCTDGGACVDAALSADRTSCHLGARPTSGRFAALALAACALATRRRRPR